MNDFLALIKTIDDMELMLLFVNAPEESMEYSIILQEMHDRAIRSAEEFRFYSQLLLAFSASDQHISTNVQQMVFRVLYDVMTDIFQDQTLQEILIEDFLDMGATLRNYADSLFRVDHHFLKRGSIAREFDALATEIGYPSDIYSFT